jgi:hypothetical protein
MTPDEIALSRDAVRRAALDPSSVAARLSYAAFVAETYKSFGEKLYVFGHILGSDRRDGLSPFGHGDDAAVAFSMLLRIASELTAGCAELISGGRHYAGAALARQLVEVEYLAWAFERGDEESRRWLRSTREERQSFFTPAKLRKAADGHFRSADYSFHCELGGHPVPGAWRLLTDADPIGQLMLFDCLGHATHIWNHFLGWTKSYEVIDKAFADMVFGQYANASVVAMRQRSDEWRRLDALTSLPPPPINDLEKL